MTQHLSHDPTARVVITGLDKFFTLHHQGGAHLDVLYQAELVVRAGECVALAGRSGSGKSTLLRCLFGNYSPNNGSVWIFDRQRWVDFAHASPREIRQARIHSVGWVSQFLRVIPRVPAMQVVAEPLVRSGVTPSVAVGRATSMLRRLNIPERLWSLAPATFSGGEQQRVNLARGLIAQHSILLVDEPTASLDELNASVVIELINEARERGSAVIGIFHDEDVRLRVATRSVEVEQFSRPVPAAASAYTASRIG